MITLTGIQKQHGNQVLFVDASMQLNPGEKVGLTGPNGAGKSTVFRLIVGQEKPDGGDDARQAAIVRAAVAAMRTIRLTSRREYVID